MAGGGRPCSGGHACVRGTDGANKQKHSSLVLVVLASLGLLPSDGAARGCGWWPCAEGSALGGGGGGGGQAWYLVSKGTRGRSEVSQHSKLSFPRRELTKSGAVIGLSLPLVFESQKSCESLLSPQRPLVQAAVPQGSAPWPVG